jgi:ABC-2 type transport system permease protein
MIRAFFFFFVRSFRNRIRARLNRLRQPKYLVSALAGAAYLYFFFLRQGFSPRRARTMPLTLDSSFFPVAEAGFAALLFVVVLWPWLWPSPGQSFSFSEAEVQFLFPAPLKRKDLLRFRILKSQFGIVFGALVSVVIFGRGRFLPHTGFFIITLWLVYTFVSLCNMATSLAKLSLAQNGTDGFRRQAWSLGIVGSAILSIYVWWKWFIPDAPHPEHASLTAVTGWITKIAESGPAYFLLLPFRFLIRPAFSAGWIEFALNVVPALLLVWVSYQWVLRGDTQFEEASLARSEKAARKLDEMRRGTYGAKKVRAGAKRSVPFALAPEGRAFVALFWKNMISATRMDLRRMRFVVLILGAVLGVMIGRSGRNVAVDVLGGISAGLLGLMTLLGPIMMRQDLRSDMSAMEALKALPMPGWSIVLGEILAPWAMLTGIQWILLPVAACALPRMGAWDLPQVRLAIAVSAALLFPCFTLIGLMIQNAAVLILPAWVQAGRASRRGIEAMGQRLISLAATLLLVIFAVLPAAAIFGALFLAGYWVMGFAVGPLASLGAAIGLLAEAVLALVWLGRTFDRFDASRELLSTLDTSG